MHVYIAQSADCANSQIAQNIYIIHTYACTYTCPHTCTYTCTYYVHVYVRV